MPTWNLSLASLAVLQSVNSFWAGLFMCEIQPRVLEMIAQKNRQLKHPQLSIFAEKVVIYAFFLGRIENLDILLV